MIQIPNGFKFALNADGTALVCGYQHNVRHIDLLTGQESWWHRNGVGEWYPLGWSESGNPCVFTTVQANPPLTDAREWLAPLDQSVVIGTPEYAIGHGDLLVYAGDVLSTNGTTLWHNGQDITPPEPFSGVVWSGSLFYGYATDNGVFRVRRLSDNTAMEEQALGAAQCPYAINGDHWISGYSYNYGGAWVENASTGKYIVGEIPGPIFEYAGVVYVVTGIMGSQNQPRGVMVRPWSEFHAGGHGWYLDGIRHQMLQARVRPDGSIVVGGCEFPGSGVITLDVIEAGRPIGPVPPEGPIDPPPIDPEEPEMATAAEVAAIVKASEKRVMNAVAIMLGQLVKLNEDGSVTPLGKSTGEKLDDVEKATRAQRDGTVGSFFGTQAMTIKPNLKP